ncbi:MAG: MFS transporter [Proteobacteria bacterium]|nr:MFS transporter [Pseudomonadota bacterium]
MWFAPVVMPAVQAEFAITRGEAALPYTFATLGFAFGSVLMGRLADRHGIVVAVVGGTLALGAGFIAVGAVAQLWQLVLVYGLLIGVGSGAMFGPLMADISHWFTRRRGLAVAIAASGSYFAGALWPPIVQHGVAQYGWRATHVWIGVFCVVSMLPLAFLLHRRVEMQETMIAGQAAAGARGALGISPGALQVLLCVAGVACCVAMAMPQVHIVAYCSDLGFGVARGAEMLSLMLGFGIISRVASGYIADRIGGVRTLLLGSLLQGVALMLYLLFDGLTSLYVVSALFGLFQGGIVPSYAFIVREYFPPHEAGTRLGLVIMSTLFGMALGGWMSGMIFDLTGSYASAFLNGLAWNLLNVCIGVWLLLRPSRRLAITA